MGQGFGLKDCLFCLFFVFSVKKTKTKQSKQQRNQSKLDKSWLKDEWEGEKGEGGRCSGSHSLVIMGCYEAFKEWQTGPSRLNSKVRQQANLRRDLKKEIKRQR